MGLLKEALEQIRWDVRVKDLGQQLNLTTQEQWRQKLESLPDQSGLALKMIFTGSHFEPVWDATQDEKKNYRQIPHNHDKSPANSHLEELLVQPIG